MENKVYDVVALGELLVDFTECGLSENDKPLLEANPGGAPCNVLAMLQRLGNKTAFIGKVGKDSFGDMLEDAVSTLGICTNNLLRDEKIPTTLAFVHNKEDGDREFSFYRNPGADVMLKKEEIDFSMIKKSKIFHFGTLSMTDELNCEATKAAVEYAKEQGLLVSFDPNLRKPLWKNLDDAHAKMEYGLKNCDILKISDDEIQFFTGKKSVDEGLLEIANRFPKKLICGTLGAKGSKTYYNDCKNFLELSYEDCYTAEAFVTDKTVDTTGAGDTFMGCVLGFVLNKGIENLRREDIEQMVSFASAAASIVTTRKGALSVMPYHEEISELLKNQG